MITIPSPNPIENTALVNYSYDVDPSTSINSQAISNLELTQVNVASLGLNKYADKNYVKLQDTLTYTVVLSNYGNVTAQAINFVDTIPLGLLYVPGSFNVDGTPIAGDPNSGITVPDIVTLGTSTITFIVEVVSIPSPSSIGNQAVTQYEFVVDPLLPPNSAAAISGLTSGTINDAVINNPSGGFSKYSDKPYVNVGDTITYSIVVKNTGNVVASNVVLIDTTPNGTSFVTNSATIDGVAQLGADPNPPLGMAIGSLAPGATSTITFKVVVMTIPTVNPMSNTASIVFDFTLDPSLPNQISGGNSTIAVNQVNNANFNNSGIVTYVDKAYAQVNDVLNYTVIITNTGNVTAQNSFLIDSIPGGTSFVTNSVVVDGVARIGETNAPPTGLSLGNIVAGQAVTVTYQLLITAIPTVNPIPVESILNYQYTVDPLNPLVSGSNLSNQVLTEVNQAAIDAGNGGFTKLVDKTYVSTGDTVEYTIIVKNTGNVSATNVVVIDTIPTNSTFVDNSFTIDGVAQPGANPNPPTGVNIGNVQAGQTSTLTFVVTVTTIATSTPIQNTATIQFNFTVVPTIPDGGSGNGNSNAVSTVISTAVIDNATGGFTKVASKSYVDLNEQILYTLVLKNTGNTAANNVVVIDTIPYGLTFVNGSVMINNVSSPSSNPNTGINITTINANQTVTITFLAEVNTIPTINPIQNSASVSFTYTSDPSVPNGNSGTGSSNTTSSQMNNANFLSSLGGLSKTSTPQYAKIGDTITYTIRLENKGTVQAENTVVIDTIPTNTVFVANSLNLNGVAQPGSTVEPPTGFSLGTVLPGAVNTITFEVVVISLPSINPVSNTVYVGYDYTTDPSIPNGNKGQDSATGGESEVNMAIIDSANGYTKYVDKTYGSIYQNLTYTIAIKNSGNVTATNVVLLDTVPTELVFVPGSVYINSVNVIGVNPTVAPGATVGDIAPGSTSTVSFKVLITTIPSPNPTQNSSLVNFNYTSDPLIPDGESGASNSNTTSSQINSAVFASFNGTFPKLVNGQQSVYSTVNDILVYSISFTNIGNVDANNVVFKDTIPTSTTFIANSVMVNGTTIPGVSPDPSTGGITLGTLLPGVTTTINFQVMVSSIPSTSTVTNTGLLSYTFTSDPTQINGVSGTDRSNDAVAQLSYALIGGDGFTKSQNRTYSEIGDIITYTIGVKNTGVTTANSVMLYDTIPAGSQYLAGSTIVDGVPGGGSPEAGISLGSLAVNAVKTVNFSVQVISIPTGGVVSNRAYASYSWIVDPTIGNTSSTTNYSNETMNSAYNAELTTSKTSTPSYATLGDTITYSIVITNTGNATANNVSIIDTIPSNTVYVNDSLTENGVVQPGADPTMSYNIGTINPSATTTVQFMVLVVTLPTVNPTSNTLYGGFNYIVDPSVPAKPGSFTATSNPTQINSANFDSANGGFSKYSSSQYVTLGDTITYTLVLMNKGNVPAQNVVAKDTVPAGTTYVNNSVMVNGVASTDSIETGVSLGTLMPYVPVTLTYKVLVTTVTADYYIRNTANVEYVYSVDPTAANVDGSNSSTEAVSYEKVPQVVITSTSNKNKLPVGGSVVYEVTIKNTGNTEAQNVRVCVTIASGLKYTPDSTVIDGVKSSQSLVECITIPSIMPNSIVKLSFGATVVSVPRGGLAVNGINACYDYLVDPSLPMNRTCSQGETPVLLIYYNFSSSKILPADDICNPNSQLPTNLISLIGKSSNINCSNSKRKPKEYSVSGLCSGEDYICVTQDIINYKMWQELSIDMKVKMPDDFYCVDNISATLTIVRSDKIDTPNTRQCSNLEGKKLSGNKQIVESVIKYTIKYINKSGSLCSVEYFKPFSAFIVLNPDYANIDLEVRNCIEDITISTLCENCLTLSTTVLLYLIEKSTEDSDCSEYNENNTLCISNSDLCSSVCSFMDDCHKYWKEFDVTTVECTERVDIGELVSVNAIVTSVKTYNISTPLSYSPSNEGLSLSGNILLVCLTIEAKLTYVSNDGSNSLRQISMVIPASSYIVVDALDDLTYCAINKYSIKACIEDIYVCNLDGKNLFTNTTIIVKASEYNSLPLNSR